MSSLDRNQKTDWREPESVCLISLRNLGDAAIHAHWLTEAAGRGYARRYMVWTKPETAMLFRGIPNCEIVTSPAPLGTARSFQARDLGALLGAAGTLRRMLPAATLDLVGDVRERALARLICAPHHVHIGWATGHPFARVIRNPFGPGSPAFTVPAETVNLYAALAMFLDRLCPPLLQRALPQRTVAGRSESFRVGLHPLASQACKLWQFERWCELARRLSALGVHVTVYCAPHERSMVERIFGTCLNPIDIVSGSLESFALSVSDLDLMVGLDSFAVHVAERVGVRSIMLVGANPAELWTPPHGRAIASDGDCPHHPCFNVPRCLDEAQPYACVRTIAVDRVAREVSDSQAEKERHARA